MVLENDVRIKPFDCFNDCLDNVGLIVCGEDATDELILNYHMLFYVFEGTAMFKGVSFGEMDLHKGQIAFLPVGTEAMYSVSADLQCLYFRLDDETPVGEYYHLDLTREFDLKRVDSNIDRVVDANELIGRYMTNLRFVLEQNLLNNLFFEIKIKELLYLLKVTFTKKELTGLWDLYRPEFSNFYGAVVRNCRENDTVAKLAELMHYTVSGFEKRFKKTFGVSPARWLRSRKAKRIYKEVSLGSLNFKEIADRYNFSSTSTFNDFFKSTFGKTPGEVRGKISSKRI